MKDLIIVCAGGFGKEALSVAEAMNKVELHWNILGFIDDTKEFGEEIFRGYKVLGSIKNWQPKPNEYFAIGMANPQAKEKLYNIIHSRGGKFATLIHPSLNIPNETVIGEGCILSLAWIGINVTLGKCVHVAGSMIGEAIIDDFSTTTGFANIAGAKIGKRVFIGSHAVVLNGKKVGDDVTIGAGSIVFNNVKSNTTVIGNPARKLDF